MSLTAAATAVLTASVLTAATAAIAATASDGSTGISCCKMLQFGGKLHPWFNSLSVVSILVCYEMCYTFFDFPKEVILRKL